MGEGRRQQFLGQNHAYRDAAAKQRVDALAAAVTQQCSAGVTCQRSAIVPHLYMPPTSLISGDQPHAHLIDVFLPLAAPRVVGVVGVVGGHVLPSDRRHEAAVDGVAVAADDDILAVLCAPRAGRYNPLRTRCRCRG